jgi:hypothetical protein
MEDVTPLVKPWKKEKPNVKHIKVFGSTCCVCPETIKTQVEIG